MALTKLSLAILILILTLTVIDLEIQHVEGRHLKKNRSGEPHANKAIVPEAMARTTASESKTMVESQIQPPPHGVVDFRPTAPGHSPGAGHAVHN
ncbi:hypothetical protein SSX86_029864 [Deinandra increscens subsp. villosa]|uniref:Uncharacterized protein n=1 Tax=Deinandra increscens subsp. villosa TaxID=3103831 RepID=A0AAP0GLX9_9ASTR